MKNVTVIAIGPEQRDAALRFEEHFKDLGYGFSIISRLLEKNGFDGYDAVITPGNSYGHMTGGFDKAVVGVLGEYIDVEVRRRIRDDFMGECNVGQAFLVEVLDHDSMKAVIYAPSMRTPKQIHSLSDVPFTATWAALQELVKYELVNGSLDNVIFTMPGVRTGNIPPIVSMRQVFMAIERYTNIVYFRELFEDAKAFDRRVMETWIY